MSPSFVSNENDNNELSRDYLGYFAGADRENIHRLRQERLQISDLGRLSSFRVALEGAPDLRTNHVVLDRGVIEIGRADEITAGEKEELQKTLEKFIPWKKGPFRLFGIDIDTEWRSDLKWDRLLPHIGNLKNQVVADIGCHNGYYMYRMAQMEPKVVIGFDPYAKLYFNFCLLQKYARVPNLHFELLGVEHFIYYRNFFDTIFCLGILYHHRDPMGLLEILHASLKREGALIIDCQGIPGDDHIALVPNSRYANASGIWFLPTLPCLLNWLKRAGFQKVKVVYQGRLESDEQRRTPWAPFPSLKESLDPNDASLTIEGYPAPWRFYVVAQR